MKNCRNVWIDALVLFVRWHQRASVHLDLSQPGQVIESTLYCEQLFKTRVKQAWWNNIHITCNVYYIIYLLHAILHYILNIDMERRRYNFFLLAEPYSCCCLMYLKTVGRNMLSQAVLVASYLKGSPFTDLLLSATPCRTSASWISFFFLWFIVSFDCQHKP